MPRTDGFFFGCCIWEKNIRDTSTCSYELGPSTDYSRFHCTVGQLVFASFEKGRYPCYPWDFFLKVVHFFSLSEATLHLVIY